MQAECAEKNRRTLPKVYGCLLALLAVVTLPVVASFVFEFRTQWKVSVAWEQAQSANTMNDLLQKFGKPYYAFTKTAPHLGSKLVDDHEIPEGQTIYVFTITQMPPKFIVALIEDRSGKLLKIGLDHS